MWLIAFISFTIFVVLIFLVARFIINMNPVARKFAINTGIIFSIISFALHMYAVYRIVNYDWGGAGPAGLLFFMIAIISYPFTVIIFFMLGSIIGWLLYKLYILKH